MQVNVLNSSVTSCAAIRLERSKHIGAQSQQMTLSNPGCSVLINRITYYTIIILGLIVMFIGIAVAHALKWIKPVKLYSKTILKNVLL